MIEYEELKHKEEELRHCYEKLLCHTDVDGTVSIEHAKKLRLYGALWHHAHELLEAHEEHETAKAHRHSEMTADKMDVHATGIKSIK